MWDDKKNICSSKFIYIYILKKIKIENIKHHNIHIDVNENALNWIYKSNS